MMKNCLSNFEQISIFDIGKTPLRIDKPVRLIELFAGIGSQAKALERLGADFKHYRVCEFDKYAVKSYNAIHGTDFATSDITQITASDLGIVDTDKYCYIMTYSFPCQDLSLAGLQKGMAKGGNTRSGLLWEVERLLNECEELPQILLMENVTQVHGKKNIEHFNEWIEFLESIGYSNYWEDLNAKNYGIPQNRNRTFMVSVLGDYTYEFPKPIPLEIRLKDILEDTVDDKYYLSEAMLNWFNSNSEKQKALGNGFKFQTADINSHAKAITTRAGQRMDDNYIEEPSVKQIGNLFESKSRENPNQGRLYDKDGLSPTLGAMQGGNRQPFIVDEPRVIGGIGEKKSNGGTQWYQQDRIYDNKIAMSVTTGFLPYYKTEEPAVWDGYNQRIRVEKGTVGTLTQNCGADLKRNGYGIIEPLAYDEQNGYIRKDGTVGTLTTDGSSPKHNNRVVEGVRIRKLTPRECYRLMGFDDADFDKAAQHNSNAQLYKQAGNSIVVDVLVAIFKNMF